MSADLKRLARRAGVVLLLVSIGAVVGLELLYRSLLPPQLPTKVTRSLPALAEGALLAEMRASRAEQPILVPFLLTYFLYSQERLAPAVHAGWRHLAELQASGVLKRENSLRFHVRQAAMLTWVSRHWTTAESLQFYAAHVWTGQEPIGLEAGAARLFGKPLGSLDLAETALLVGITRSPRHFDPACHPDRAKRARRRVLDRMVEGGYIKSDLLHAVAESPIRVIGLCDKKPVADNNAMNLTNREVPGMKERRASGEPEHG